MNSHYDDAVDAYSEYCDDNGIIFQQPCAEDSFTDEDYVYLYNVNGQLAKYKIATKEIIV